MFGSTKIFINLSIVACTDDALANALVDIGIIFGIFGIVKFVIVIIDWSRQPTEPLRPCHRLNSRTNDIKTIRQQSPADKTMAS